VGCYNGSRYKKDGKPLVKIIFRPVTKYLLKLAACVQQQKYKKNFEGFSSQPLCVCDSFVNTSFTGKKSIKQISRET